MAVYAITGKLGSGKGKAGIQRLREYLQQGKRVATNCDVFLEHLDHDRSVSTVIRIPDKPSPTDLYMIGSGNKFIEFDTNIQVVDGVLKGAAPLQSPRMLPGFDEAHNGALVLDECASWLNTRDFQNKSRADLLEWAIHARKYGWDIFFIMQNISQIDKQIRDSLFEYVVRLNRLDRMKIPFVSGAIKFVSAGAMTGAMPRVHIAVVRLGTSTDGLVADRWIFQGDDLHDGYNTTQVFSDAYPHGSHTLLSAWHLSGKYGIPVDFVGPVRPGRSDYEQVSPRTLPLKPPHKHMTKFLAIAVMLGAFLGAAGLYFFGPSPAAVSSVAALPAGAKIYSDKVFGIGYFRSGNEVTVLLSDGSTLTGPKSFMPSVAGWEAEIKPGLWVKGSSQ